MKSGLVFVIGESLGIGQDVIPLYLFTNFVSCAVLFNNQNNCVFVSHYSTFTLFFSE